MESAQSAGAAPARPVVITIVCVTGLIIVLAHAAATVERLASWADPRDPAVRSMAIAGAIGLALSVASRAACMIGLWMMRKWAVYAYTALAALDQAIYLSLGSALWQPTDLIIPALFVIVMFMYLSKMR